MNKISRKEITPVFLIVVAAACCLYAGMMYLQPKLTQNSAFPDFGSILAGSMKGNFGSRVQWFLADITEATFVAAPSASIFMVIVGFIVAWLTVKKSKWAGSGMDGNEKIFPVMAGFGLLSPILAQLIFGGLFQKYGWLPTFAGFVVVQILISKYGAGIAKGITSLIIGTIVTFPICFVFMLKITIPLKFPTFLSVAYGFIVSVPICCEICNRLPWMTRTTARSETEATSESEEAKAAPPEPSPNAFFLNRIFGDVGELVCWGNSTASIAMYIGGTIGWLVNPLHPAYAAGNWPMIMCAQIVTAALSIYIWYPGYKKNGFVFTFTSLIFTSAILVTYSNSLLVVIPTIILSAVVVPPLTDWLMKVTHYSGRYPAIVYVQASVGITCTLWCLFLLHIYIPLLGL